MGLPMNPFTSPRIIGLQSDPQPSAISLRPSAPSAFNHQPSTICLRPSAFGFCLLIFITLGKPNKVKSERANSFNF
ncbi:hypothetical protein ACE6H2_026977 [Prunus campanulata]